jgi:hypothetical protein
LILIGKAFFSKVEIKIDTLKKVITFYFYVWHLLKEGSITADCLRYYPKYLNVMKD